MRNKSTYSTCKSLIQNTHEKIYIKFLMSPMASQLWNFRVSTIPKTLLQARKNILRLLVCTQELRGHEELVTSQQPLRKRLRNGLANFSFVAV
jgi:hypothetical protein